MYLNYAQAVWSASSVLKTSTDASWNTNTNRLTFVTAGLYEITVIHQIVGDAGLAAAAFATGAISPLATAGVLNSGSEHPFAATPNGITVTDIFYYQAAAGESIDVVAQASSSVGTPVPGLGVTAQMAVRKLS